MPEAVYVFASLALLLAGAAVLLWRWADRRRARGEAGRHMAQQVSARIVREEVAFDPRTAVPAPGGRLVDPWAAPASSDAGSRGATTGPAFKLPGWLQGVVGVRSVGFGLLALLVACLIAGLAAGALAAAGTFVLLGLGAALWLWLRVQKTRRKLVGQLPGFIDSMVRLIAIGNSMHAAFQHSVSQAKSPLRGHMENAASLVRAGVDLDQALRQAADNAQVEEMHLLAAILGLGVRYGGRADVLLERVAQFMRDREQAQQELVAMSAETRLSAWILGLLPVAVCAMIITVNPAYFHVMLNDDSGRLMLLGAVAMQAFGAVLLYRLAKQV
ncbi:MAG: secretion system protein [Comamonadaceae bacterium]|nr:MAG: secretion system protein [Comamonadaceae bacterium]